jgi:U6 snRNA-associated Sm-like protein LSm1
MAFNPSSSHGGPAGAQPNINMSFNQMLQRSMQEQGQHESIAEAPSNPAQSIGMNTPPLSCSEL